MVAKTTAGPSTAAASATSAQDDKGVGARQLDGESCPSLRDFENLLILWSPR